MLSWLALWSIPGGSVGKEFRLETFPGGFRPAMSLLSLVLPSSVNQKFVVNCLCFGISLPFVVYSLFTLLT